MISPRSAAALAIDRASHYAVALPFMAVLSVLDFFAARVGDSLDRRLCEWPRLTDDEPSP